MASTMWLHYHTNRTNHKVFYTTRCEGRCTFCTINFPSPDKTNLEIHLPSEPIPIPIAVVEGNNVKFLRFGPPNQFQPIEKWLLSAENFKRQPAGRHIEFPCNSLVMTVDGTLYYWKRVDDDVIELRSKEKEDRGFLAEIRESDPSLAIDMSAADEDEGVIDACLVFATIYFESRAKVSI